MAKASVIAARQADMLTLIAERLARIEAHMGIMPQQPVAHDPVEEAEWHGEASIGAGQSAAALIQNAEAQPNVEIGSSGEAKAVEVSADAADEQAESAEMPSSRGNRSGKK